MKQSAQAACLDVNLSGVGCLPLPHPMRPMCPYVSPVCRVCACLKLGACIWLHRPVTLAAVRKWAHSSEAVGAGGLSGRELVDRGLLALAPHCVRLLEGQEGGLELLHPATTSCQI